MDKKPKLDVAKRLKQALDRSKIKQVELADRFDLTPQAVRGWFFTGRISRPRLLKLCEILRVSYNWVMTGRGSMDPDPNATSERYIELLAEAIQDIRRNEEEFGRYLPADEFIRSARLIADARIIGKPVGNDFVERLVKLFA